MGCAKIDDAMKNINDVVFSDSAEQSQSVYDSWSKAYDENMVVLGSAYAPETGKMFCKYGKKCSVMLDIGAGTGGVIEYIRESGFNGIVDVMDANLSMLLQAESKNLNLRNIIRHFVSDEGDLPLKDGTYDVITSAGSFIPNHIAATALKGVVNAVKISGYLIITTRSKSTEGYKLEFDQVINELEQSGKVEVIETEEFRHFPKTNENVFSMVYVLKRLS